MDSVYIYNDSCNNYISLYVDYNTRWVVYRYSNLLRTQGFVDRDEARKMRQEKCRKRRYGKNYEDFI